MLSSLAWADSLTNISIGGLLSEASLQGNINQCDPVPTANQSSLQQLPFSSDSFDAAIAAHIYSRHQGPTPPSLLSHSSILDAEETCHAFSFQKFSLSGKEIVSSSISGSSRGCSQDACSKSFKFPNFVEVGVKTGNTQDQTQEPKADTRPQTQGADNGENSLGMSDINRTDSLWSLDLSLSSSRQIIKGDSVSLGGLLSNSLDAFQSRSFFLRDEMVPPT
ncbi:PREDICTED: TSL-kinase interacting protein 1-like [Nelumbo nucifera]|nr:PREDICTED: TSL-kinase interacting protein 1-like [Nelumbo nucifera]